MACIERCYAGAASADVDSRRARAHPSSRRPARQGRGRTEGRDPGGRRVRRVDPHGGAGRCRARGGARADREVPRVRRPPGRRDARSGHLPRVRPGSGRRRPAGRGRGRTGDSAGHGARGERADRFHDRWDRADRVPAAAARLHGPGPRPLPGRLVGGRAPHGRLPGATGDAPDPGERDRGADRRGAPGCRCGRCRESCRGSSSGSRPRRVARLGRMTSPGGLPREPRDAAIPSPGGLRARWRWGNSRQSRAVFALSEAGGALHDHGRRVSDDPDALCRAELRMEGPRGAWTARFASAVYDEPRAVYLDEPALLVVGYGFHTFGLEAATGEARWEHRSATPLIALFGSSRLPHVLVQSEIETFAIDTDGTVAWRIAHSDVVVAAELMMGRLVLTGFDGQVNTLDAATGRAAG